VIGPQDVVLVVTETVYPDQAPFDPSSRYLEYRFETIAERSNAVYGVVRQAFADADLDQERFGTPRWNPLGSLMTSGEFVLIKPSLVKETHPRDPDGWRYVLTHGSVIRAVVEFVFMAVGPTGRVTIADAPQTDSLFSKIVDFLGLDQLRDSCGARGLDLDLIDLRNEEWANEKGAIVVRHRLLGGPLQPSKAEKPQEGRRDVEHEESDRRQCGQELAAPPLRGRTFHRGATNTQVEAPITSWNAGGRGCFAGSWFACRRSGPGFSGSHDAPGLRSSETPRGRAERELVGQRHDLENLLGPEQDRRLRPDGSLRPEQPEHRCHHLVLVDGIGANQGNGPMNPDPLPAGVILFWTNSPSVGAVRTVLMGYDPEKALIMRQAFCCNSYPLSEWG
jgi:hypothetical protein